MKKCLCLILLLFMVANGYAMMLPSMDEQNATKKCLDSRRAHSKRLESFYCDRGESLLRKQEEKLRKKEAQQRRLEKKQQENALRSGDTRSRKKSKRQTPESWAAIESEPDLLHENSRLSGNESSHSSQGDSECFDGGSECAEVKRVHFGHDEIRFFYSDEAVKELSKEPSSIDEECFTSVEEYCDSDDKAYFVDRLRDIEDFLLRKRKKRKATKTVWSRDRRSRKKSKRQTPESWAALECEPDLLIEDGCLSDDESSESDQSDSECSGWDSESSRKSYESREEDDNAVYENGAELTANEECLSVGEERSDDEAGGYYDEIEDSLLRKLDKRGFKECMLQRKEKYPKKSKRRTPKSWAPLESDVFGDEKTYKQLEKLARCVEENCESDEEGVSMSLDYLSLGLARFLKDAGHSVYDELLREKVEDLYRACEDVREKYDGLYNAVKSFEEEIENFL